MLCVARLDILCSKGWKRSVLRGSLEFSLGERVFSNLLEVVAGV